MILRKKVQAGLQPVCTWIKKQLKKYMVKQRCFQMLWFYSISILLQPNFKTECNQMHEPTVQNIRNEQVSVPMVTIKWIALYRNKFLKLHWVTIKSKMVVGKNHKVRMCPFDT